MRASCRVGTCPLGKAFFLCCLGGSLSRGGARVPLASHEGEHTDGKEKRKIRSLNACLNLDRGKKSRMSIKMSPFLGFLGDDGFGQHVLVQVRLEIPWIGVLETDTHTQKEAFSSWERKDGLPHESKKYVFCLNLMFRNRKRQVTHLLYPTKDLESKRSKNKSCFLASF